MATEQEIRDHVRKRLAVYRLPNEDSLVEYLVVGCPVGGFLGAVIENNLAEAFGRADDRNRDAMYQYASCMYNEFPAGSWGSRDEMAAWIEGGGLWGRRALESKGTP